jgi:hypothetical protein
MNHPEMADDAASRREPPVRQVDYIVVRADGTVTWESAQSKAGNLLRQAIDVGENIARDCICGVVAERALLVELAQAATAHRSTAEEARKGARPIPDETRAALVRAVAVAAGALPTDAEMAFVFCDTRTLAAFTDIHAVDVSAVGFGKGVRAVIVRGRGGGAPEPEAA